MQKKLAFNTSQALLKLERKLKEERNLVLLQKEMIWRQKARIDWLRCTDRNKKFFHTTTLIKRRQNWVEALLDDQRVWVDDGKKLKEMDANIMQISSIQIHWQGVSSKAIPTARGAVEVEFEGWLFKGRGASLSKWDVILKVPGPDGFQAVFFKRTWDITVQEVYSFVWDMLKGRLVPR